MEVDANIVQNVLLVPVDRTEVDQAPLAKVYETHDLHAYSLMPLYLGFQELYKLMAHAC